jgi:hypothetical protein
MSQALPETINREEMRESLKRLEKRLEHLGRHL